MTAFGRQGLARNYSTDHIYTEINLLLLNNTRHPNPHFLTFNQVKEQGKSLKKGTKAEKAILLNVYYIDGNDQTLTKEEAKKRNQS